jgi:predicted adenine nucleotide alpha hydrolase (AANH) superfamily ATPase
MREQGMEPVGLFYNPNIHPFQEYRKRRETVKDFAGRSGLEVVYRDEDELDAFLQRTAGTGSKRCEHCYRMRLDKAGKIARERGIGSFTTTLLYSKHQKHDLIAAIGREAATDHGVEFYYEDFRHGWREGIVESKAMGLYRQQYCGCIFSEYERYAKGGL